MLLSYYSSGTKIQKTKRKNPNANVLGGIIFLTCMLVFTHSYISNLVSVTDDYHAIVLVVFLISRRRCTDNCVFLIETASQQCYISL